ncbi:gibberellin A4 carboxyl methyltransferase [Ranunculus cassubicifolius]
MEDEKNISEYLCMNGGTGPLSYANNSSYQKAVVICSKAMVKEAIADMFDIQQSSVPIRIADLGCSVGPNTFIAVQNIVEAIEQKYKSQGLSSNIAEFQVYFNDHVSNDFNTLFASLPHDRRYFAVGVPGPFQGRLFPKGSIHFIYSSYALHWLSNIPGEVLDQNSPAWSKEKIHYTNDSNKLLEAYSSQFGQDFQSFLNTRAQEIAPGGLMALLIPVVPNGTLPSVSFICLLYELLGFSLMDMAQEGLVSEAKLHSFNLPIFYASPQELEDLVRRNGCFSIEKMVTLDNQMKHSITCDDYELCIMHIRVGTELLIKEHFRSEIVDELFDRFTEKVAEKSHYIFKHTFMDNWVEQFVLLKRLISS